MPNNEIQLWLQQARKSGLSGDQIRLQLRQAGWTDEQINKQLLAVPPHSIPKSAKSDLFEEALTIRKTGKKKGWIAIVIVIIIIGLGIFAYTKGYFSFSSKENRFIKATADLVCFEYTNKIMSFQQEEAQKNGQPVMSENEAKQLFRDEAKKILPKYGFTYEEYLNYSNLMLEKEQAKTISALYLKIDEEAKKKCGAPTTMDLLLNNY